MFKLLAVMSLCLALSMVASQSCTDTNNLRSLYGFSNTLTTAQTYSDLGFCKSLKSSPVCCTDTDINSLQTKSNTLIQNLTAAVITRDKYFAANSGNVIGDLQTSLTNFATAMSAFSTKLALSAATPNSATFQSLANIDNMLTGITPDTASLTAAFTSVDKDFVGFQKARSSCIIELVKLQNAAWCLSCDPAAATKGYDSATGDISISDTTCTRLQNSCYSFLTLGDYQNAVLGIRDTIDSFNHYTTTLQSINNGANPDVTSFDYTSTIPVSAYIPDNCTSASNCQFICDGLFANGVINQAELAAGGDLDDVESRRLAGRMLVSGSFNPDEDEAGVAVTFAQDPAGTQNTGKFSGLSFGSVLGGMMVMISCILLF